MRTLGARYRQGRICRASGVPQAIFSRSDEDSGLDAWASPVGNEVAAHRTCHCFLRTRTLGIISIYSSIYLHDSIGPVGKNVVLMNKLGAHLLHQGVPFLCAGGWNVTPGVLRASLN